MHADESNDKSPDTTQTHAQSDTCGLHVNIQAGAARAESAAYPLVCVAHAALSLEQIMICTQKTAETLRWGQKHGCHRTGAALSGRTKHFQEERSTFRQNEALPGTGQVCTVGLDFSRVVLVGVVRHG